MKMSKILTIKNATLKYRNKVIFTGLNLNINANEHLAVVGESGSGKSSLLNLIAGRGFLSAGSISNFYYQDYLKTHTISDPLFSHRSLISFVSAENDLMGSNVQDSFYQQRFNAEFSDDALTVEDYLNQKAEEKNRVGKWNIDRVYKTFSLHSLSAKHLTKLSNGESKRVRIGAALLSSPLLLLLDNPLSGLDADTRNTFECIFNEITQSGITIIMVTDPDEIPKVVTHVAVTGKNKKLNIFKRDEFNQDQFNKNISDTPDAEKIKRLLSRRESLESDMLVSMNNIRVVYGDNLVLDNINWEIKQGERWALSGPNGSGKSTLMSLINGDHPQAYANDISLFGKKRGTGESIWDIKKRIGFMSSELQLYFPHDYTCRQVIESGFYDTIGLFRKHDEENRQKAEQWIEILGLIDIKDNYLYELSNSRKRLCLLARALVKNPYLLLLDEPCAGLDTAQQKQFRNIIDTMADINDIAIIYVTHHQETLPDCITNRFKLV